MQEKELQLNDIFNSMLGIPVETFELLKNHGVDTIGVYLFYYYTAKWQGTNQPQCTVGYISKGLGITQERVQRARRILLENTLIEDIIRKDSLGKVVGHYVKINHTSTLLLFRGVESSLKTGNEKTVMAEDSESIHPRVFPGGGKSRDKSYNLNNKMLINGKQKTEIDKPVIFESDEYSVFANIYKDYAEKDIIDLDKISPPVYLKKYTRDSLSKLAVSFLHYWGDEDKYKDEKKFNVKKRFKTFVLQDFKGILHKLPVWKGFKDTTEDDYKRIYNEGYLKSPACKFYTEVILPTLSDTEKEKFPIVMDFIVNNGIGPRAKYTLEQWLTLKGK